jgi:hypothetical protein
MLRYVDGVWILDLATLTRSSRGQAHGSRPRPLQSNAIELSDEREQCSFEHAGEEFPSAGAAAAAAGAERFSIQTDPAISASAGHTMTGSRSPNPTAATAVPVIVET